MIIDTIYKLRCYALPLTKCRECGDEFINGPNLLRTICSTCTQAKKAETRRSYWAGNGTTERRAP